jgi:SAM-dependent methyltransferase
MSTSIAPYAETPLAQEILEKFLDWVEGFQILTGQTVIEFGCGAGHSTEKLLARLGSRGFLTAVEPDAKYLEEAKKRLEDKDGIAEVTFVQAKAQNLDKYWNRVPFFEPAFFIWANGIHYLENENELTSFFQDMFDSNLSGFFCTAFWQGSVGMRDFAVLGRMVQEAVKHLGLDPADPQVPKAKRLHEWKPEDYERFAREAGYEVELVQVPMQLGVDVYQGIAYDETWVNNSLPPEGVLARFSQEQRTEALVVGASRAYQQMEEKTGKTTTQSIWLFGRVA